MLGMVKTSIAVPKPMPKYAINIFAILLIFFFSKQLKINATTKNKTKLIGTMFSGVL